MPTYTIRTDSDLMDDFEADDLAEALELFDAPSGVTDAGSFCAWLERCGGYGWIEEDGERIATVSS